MALTMPRAPDIATARSTPPVRGLGLPGAVSFRRFGPIVLDAGLLAGGTRTLDAETIRAEARALRLETGEGRLPRDATARFLALAREPACVILDTLTIQDLLLRYETRCG